MCWKKVKTLFKSASQIYLYPQKAISCVHLPVMCCPMCVVYCMCFSYERPNKSQIQILIQLKVAVDQCYVTILSAGHFYHHLIKP